jgi:phage baseplate assembly protein W
MATPLSVQSNLYLSRVYSDININFDINPVTNDLLKVVGTNSVVQSLISLVQLNHYEKPFHPEIGSNIRKLLFEPLDPVTSNSLQAEIENLIANFEPRVTVIGVYIQTNYDLDGYNVTIEFNVLNVNNTLTITTFLQRLR